MKTGSHLFLTFLGILNGSIAIGASDRPELTFCGHLENQVVVCVAESKDQNYIVTEAFDYLPASVFIGKNPLVHHFSASHAVRRDGRLTQTNYEMTLNHDSHTGTYLVTNSNGSQSHAISQVSLAPTEANSSERPDTFVD